MTLDSLLQVLSYLTDLLMQWYLTMRVIRSRASLQYKTLVQIFPIRITGVFQYIATTQLKGSVIVIFLH